MLQPTFIKWNGVNVEYYSGVLGVIANVHLIYVEPPSPEPEPEPEPASGMFAHWHNRCFIRIVCISTNDEIPTVISLSVYSSSSTDRQAYYNIINTSMSVKVPA